MPEENVTSEILEKLAKLVRHEQSAREIGNITEAEAFAGKVQELLTKYKLEMSDIQFEERERDEPIEESHVSAREAGVKRESRRVEWQEELAYVIARCNGCKTLVSDLSNTAFFVGRKSDREVCSFLYAHFVRMAFEMSEKASKVNLDACRAECQKSYGDWWRGQMSSWMKDYRKSFCRGFSDAVQRRLRNQHESMMEAEEKRAEESAQQSTALVHIRRDQEAIAQYLEDKFKDRKPSRRKDNIDDSGWSRTGFQHGRAAGESVALTANALGSGGGKGKLNG
jgi:hypothetical protein